MIEYRPAQDRFRTEAGGRTTWHSFSFGAHYDPGNVGFASLVAHNDELLPPGTGYDDHPHTDLEIVTWVLSGALRHTSSVGSAVIGPGQVQRLSAGAGVVHSEVADGRETTRFLQAWVRPDEPGLVPGYVSAEVALHRRVDLRRGRRRAGRRTHLGARCLAERGRARHSSATVAARGAEAARVRCPRTGPARRANPGGG